MSKLSSFWNKSESSAACSFGKSHIAHRYVFWIPVCAGITVFLVLAQAQATESPQLQKCLQRVDELPDMAAAEAQVWIKKNGGDDAHLCRAFAQSNRNMHADAAREFWGLASHYEKTDARKALLMHNFSGQEFLRAKDNKNAEGQFVASLKIASNDVTALTGRAEVRIDVERYWDALDDLNHALKIKPDDVAALRQRGLAWMRLGNEKNAQEDFDKAETLAPQGK